MNLERKSMKNRTKESIELFRYYPGINGRKYCMINMKKTMKSRDNKFLKYYETLCDNECGNVGMKCCSHPFDNCLVHS